MIIICVCVGVVFLPRNYMYSADITNGKNHECINKIPNVVSCINLTLTVIWMGVGF